MTKKTRKLVVHMVGNAHLDPAWLWTWPAGVDEALATCRTACDLLDEYPGLHVTRGEAWVYFQIQRLDPVLFKRMVSHVRAGRLHVVNGWWVQPDCNLPGSESFLKQSEIGGRYFKAMMGIDVKVGYNVDSFGHCAMLPSFLRQGGKEFYVFGRPGENEMSLPSDLFRWRSPDGAEVLAFRVTGYGASSVPDMRKNLEAAINLPCAGIGHVMCFYGIGDHGGGPTRDQIEWIRDHKRYSGNVELRFSDPASFFAAVKSRKASLPIVTGELNPHAVGCYTVVRDIKREVRRAETMLGQAERLAAKNGATKDKALRGRIEEAWRTLLFNQFHDIMGGSSIKSVCAQSLEELGAVKSFARDLIVEFTRKANVALHPCQRQRIVIDNLADHPWQGHVECNPWFNNDGAPFHFALQDEEGAPLPFQSVTPTYPGPGTNNILIPVKLAAGERRIAEIRRLKNSLPATKSSLQSDGRQMSNGAISLNCDSTGISSISFNSREVLRADGMRVCVFEDNSDTWSHNVRSYDGPLVETFASDQPWSILENGPIRASMINTLHCKSGMLQWIVRLLDGGHSLQLRLNLNWWGRNKIVKLIVPPGFKASVRRDGTPGAILERPMDKREYPVTDIVSVAGMGSCLTAVSPDIYSADVTPDGTMRITLLRCPTYSHHDPAWVEPNSPYPVTDQGVHDYEIDILPAAAFRETDALEAARRLNSPLWISDTTKGMPSGWRYDNPPKQIPLGMPPVPPVEALMPGDLLRFARGSSQSVVAGEKLCKQWRGEWLLVSRSPALGLNLPVSVEGKYRFSLARLSGKGFGKAELFLDGRRIAVFPSGERAPAPAVEVIPELPIRGVEAALELKAKGGNRMAIGFLHMSPIYKDIPASAWVAAGPFIRADDKSHHASGSVETCIKESVYPPEKVRNFDATYKLTDGSDAKWQSLKGEADYINFLALTGKMTGSIHYAVTHVWSDARRKARLSFGVDYWHKIWINGALAEPFGAGGGAPFKGQLSLDVQLDKGWNELMLKVASGAAGNGFWMAISDYENLKFANRFT